MKKVGLDYEWIYRGSVVADSPTPITLLISETLITSGLRYAEVELATYVAPGGHLSVGIKDWSAFNVPGMDTGLSATGRVTLNLSTIATDGPIFTAGDVWMLAFNVSTLKVWVGKVGSGWYNGGDPAAGTGEIGVFPSGTEFGVGVRVTGSGLGNPTPGSILKLRTQSSQFTGTIPSGFSPWYP
jgi:hypothetical protein